MLTFYRIYDVVSCTEFNDIESYDSPSDALRSLGHPVTILHWSVWDHDGRCPAQGLKILVADRPNFYLTLTRLVTWAVKYWVRVGHAYPSPPWKVVGFKIPHNCLMEFGKYHLHDESHDAHVTLFFREALPRIGAKQRGGRIPLYALLGKDVGM